MRAAGYRGPKVFTREAIKGIARASQGLTRRINILADKALLAAFARGTHAVTAAEVKRAVRDSEFYRAGSGAQKIRIGVTALAAGLILGWAMHMLLPLGAPQPQAGFAPALAPTSRPEPSVAPIAAAVALPAQSPAPTARLLPGQAADAPGRKPVAPVEGELARQRFDAAQTWLRDTPGGLVRHPARHGRRWRVTAT